ncbi:MAG TPA: serpin family protein [Opitutaceae bacterium]|nr:serpin family protein [Opitutaceae bacterium]
MESYPRPALRGAIALALVAALAGPRAGAAQPPAADAAHAGAALGADLYRLFAAREGNIVFSPYSISEALALLSAGAGGKTRQELLDTLHWTLPSDQMAAAFGAQDRQLAGAAGDGAVLSVANGLWYQRGHEPLAAFLQAARQSYGAEVRIADFSADLPVSRHMINTWVERKTGGKITDLLPADALTPRTRLVLANAVYFKGRWERPFDAQRTVPAAFFTAAGESVMAPTMARTAQFRTRRADGCDLLDLPYAGGRLSMVIVLPEARDGLPALEEHLSAAGLSLWLESLDQAAPAELGVTLPRFKMAFAAELTKALSRLGLATAFVPGAADFSPINGRNDLYVSNVLHKAFIDVNEEGTEAAAATGVVVVKSAAVLPRKFLVDHPFLFLIRDASTGSLLFLGRIVDPRTP